MNWQNILSDIVHSRGVWEAVIGFVNVAGVVLLPPQYVPIVVAFNAVVAAIGSVIVGKEVATRYSERRIAAKMLQTYNSDGATGGES